MLSGDSKRIEGVLDGADNDAIRALLASARIAGELLPYDAVDRVFNSRDPGAQRAAEIYLVANDSPRARAILDARFNGTVIVGGREIQASRDFSVNLFEEQERQLLAKMKGDNAADEVFALLRFSGSGWSDKTAREEIVIERRGDQITGARQGSNVANTTRFVSPQEFSKLKFFIESEKVDDLGPISNLVFDATWIVEYVHLTRESARRVYMHNAILVGHKAAYQTIGEEFQRLVPAASAP
jgi:hypothetical protein